MTSESNIPLLDKRTASVTAMILAGGQSVRMGRVDKAFLEVEGTPIIARIVDLLDKIFEHVIIVTNSPDSYKFLGKPTFPDIRPGAGAIGGLHTGLSHCESQYGFLVACDMPFLNEGIIRLLVSLSGHDDVIVPVVRGHYEPLHAIYSVRCLPGIEDLINKSDLKIAKMYSHFSVLAVPESLLSEYDPRLRFIMNLNTPDDLKKARELAASSHPIP